MSLRFFIMTSNVQLDCHEVRSRLKIRGSLKRKTIKYVGTVLLISKIKFCPTVRACLNFPVCHLTDSLSNFLFNTRYRLTVFQADVWRMPGVNV